MKKADANMWWIIIGAVIALVVLVVLMVLFTGKTTILERGLLDCESKGGECLEPTVCTNQRGGTVAPSFDCSASTQGNPGGKCCFTEQKAEQPR